MITTAAPARCRFFFATVCFASAGPRSDPAHFKVLFRAAVAALELLALARHRAADALRSFFLFFDYISDSEENDHYQGYYSHNCRHIHFIYLSLSFLYTSAPQLSIRPFSRTGCHMIQTSALCCQSAHQASAVNQLIRPQPLWPRAARTSRRSERGSFLRSSRSRLRSRLSRSVPERIRLQSVLQ